MELVAAFGVAIVAGLGVALLLGRGEPGDDPLPWEIPDVARMQAGLMASLAAVAITGIVLLVGLINSTDTAVIQEMKTVALIFSIAFGFFVQTVFTLSYLPSRAAVGDRLQRLYFCLATTLEWRNVVLLSLGLTAFARLFGLELLALILNYLLLMMLAGATVVIAVVMDALGLVRFGTFLLSGIVGVVFGGTGLLALALLGVDPSGSVIAMSVAYSCVIGTSYLGAGLIPLAARRPSLKANLSQHARRLAMIDTQITMTSLVYMWLAVANPMAGLR